MSENANIKTRKEYSAFTYVESITFVSILHGDFGSQAEKLKTVWVQILTSWSKNIDFVACYRTQVT